MATYAERADFLSEKLRELEHQAQDGDQLFYCAYLLGLLGLHSSMEGEGNNAFDDYFKQELTNALNAENVSESDQVNILKLWKNIIQS